MSIQTVHWYYIRFMSRILCIRVNCASYNYRCLSTQVINVSNVRSMIPASIYTYTPNNAFRWLHRCAFTFHDVCCTILVLIFHPPGSIFSTPLSFSVSCYYYFAFGLDSCGYQVMSPTRLLHSIKDVVSLWIALYIYNNNGKLCSSQVVWVTNRFTLLKVRFISKCIHYRSYWILWYNAIVNFFLKYIKLRCISFNI